MSFFWQSVFLRPRSGSFGWGPVLTSADLRLRRARFLAAILALAPPVFAADVTVIPPREYFSTVLKEINAAQSSITVYMYVFTLPANASGSKALQLADALVRAKDRGVKVDVVLDQNMYVEDETTLKGKNLTAYSYLAQAGVPVCFEDPSTLTHAKAVVIDQETLITGSSNWSQTAFDRNHESNVLIRSSTAAREMLKLLGAVKRETPPDPGPVVSLPAGFLTDGNLFGRMVTDRDRLGLALYLFLTWKSGIQESGAVALDYAELAQHIENPPDPNRQFRNNMRTVLERLRDRYNLLDFKTHYDKPTEVYLRPMPSTETVKIPTAYWEYGWDARLSFRGQAVYLMSLRESQTSRISPRWSHGRLWLAEQYGVSPDFISSGVTELRRANLLEVEYGKIEWHMENPREPSLYTPNVLYDPADLKKGLEELQEKHGPEKLARAQKAAALVYEDSDLAGIARLIELEDRYGQAKIRWALDKMEAKSPSNPKRTLPYLIGTIRSPEEGF